MKSLRARTLLFMLVLIFICIAILGTGFIMVSKEYTIRENCEELLSNARITADAVGARAIDQDFYSLDLKMTISAMSRVTNNDIYICSTDGEIILCSQDSVVNQMMGSTIDSNIMDELYNRKEYSTYGNLNGLLNESCYISAVPVTVRYGLNFDENEIIIGYVFATMTSRNTQGLWRSSVLIFVLASVFTFIIAAIMSVFLSKKQAEPLKKIAEVARRFTYGDYSSRVPETKRKDEIGELTNDFNAMANSIEHTEKLHQELISNVSHELRTPMTSIAGFADGILDGVIPEDKIKDYVKIISDETHRLARLTNGMLDMTRVQAMSSSDINKNTFNICEVTRRALLSLENKIVEKHLTVDIEIPDEIQVYGVVDSIAQVVYNLIDNAIKFAFEDSVLKIKIEKEGEKIAVSIIDNGATIDREEIPYIFERFHKSDESRSLDKSGAGIGLYIVKTILGNHGEDIFVKSNDNITEFKFTLKPKMQ